MKNLKLSSPKGIGMGMPNLPQFICMIFLLGVMAGGCQKTEYSAPGSGEASSPEAKVASSNNLKQVNLVSDLQSYEPQFIDPELVNAWGMAFNDEGEIWVSAAEEGVSTIYDASGVTLMPPVNIPFGNDLNGGAPTGVIYNVTTADFVIPATNEKSEFIFVTENGTVAAWSSGPTAVTVADLSSFDAVYKGVTLAKNGGANFLYATNFKQARIDVFDPQFNYVEMPFVDPDIPSGYAPFNIKYLNGLLYVTYAKQLAPDNEDDEAGPGHGYVNIFNTDGSFVKRFASQGTLNSPWGIAEVPGDNSRILVGNFGDGRINIFGPDGAFKTYLKSNGQAVVIEGLWAIVFPQKNLPPEERNRLYFTAGPDEEEHGLFGFLIPND